MNRRPTTATKATGTVNLLKGAKRAVPKDIAGTTQVEINQIIVSTPKGSKMKGGAPIESKLDGTLPLMINDGGEYAMLDHQYPNSLRALVSARFPVLT